MFGQNIANTASSLLQLGISKVSATKLTLKWVAPTGGDVSARAAVVDGVVYFPDWGGNLWALNADTGAVVWHHQFSDYGLPAGTTSRASPAISHGILYIGTQQGAYTLAIDARTGALRWKTQLDTHPLAIISSSATVYDGVVYTGVASTEENVAVDPTYPCCSFRGSAMALNAETGAVIFKKYTVPTGYAGGAIWGSNPVVDPLRRSVFVGTGNNYATPTDPAFKSCIAKGGTLPSCLSPNDYVDSILALDMRTGAVKWSKRLSSSDDWNVSCIFDAPGTDNCPAVSGPDYDFGSAPNEFVTVMPDRSLRQIVGAGQKSGVYSAFDPDTGKLLWATQVGPGSSLGGIEWGSATDGQRIYVAISNLNHTPYAAGSAGSWAALDAATGKIIWQKADPNGTLDLGPMTVSYGVVYAPSMGANAPNMYALDAATGNTLWSYKTAGSVIVGAVVVDRTVYWGSGYAHLPIPGFVGNNQFFAFTVPRGY
jgi:polyvinyl alcohol dehydrogenase (cytochrome)